MAKNKKILASLDIDTKSLVKSASQMAEEIERLKNQQDKLIKKGKESSVQFVKNSVELTKLRQAYREQAKTLAAYTDEEGKILSQKKAIKQAINETNKSENDYLENNKNLIAIKKQLNSADDNYQKSLDKINRKLQDNKMWLEENGSENAKLIVTFNDFKDQLSESYNSINIFNGGIGGLISRSQEMGGAGALLKSAFSGMTSGIVGMTKAAWQFVKNPFGLILAAVAIAASAVVDIFKTFQPIVETVEKVTAAAGAAFESIKNSILGLWDAVKSGKGLLSIFIDMGENMAEAAAEAYKLKGAQQALAKQMELQEIKNAEAQKSIEAYTRASEDQTKTEEERLAALKDANELEQQNLNERKDHAEEAYRIAAEALANGANLNDKEKQLLKEQGYEYAQKLQKTKSLSEEEIEALKDAQLKRIEIQQEDADLTVKHHDNINALTDKFTDEQEDKLNKRKEQWDKYVDHMLQKQKELLDLYVAQNNGVAKTLNEQLAYQEEYMTKSIALLNEELKQKKISRLQYDTEVRNLESENTAKTLQITKKFADAELELWKQQNQSKLNNGNEFTAQMYEEEIDRAVKLRELQLKTLGKNAENDATAIAQKIATNQELKDTEIELYTQYLKIQEEYDAAVNTATEAKAESKKQAEENRKAQAVQKIREEADAEQLKFEVEMATAETQYQEKVIAEKARFASEKAELDERKAQGLIDDEQYNTLLEAQKEESAKNQKEIEQENTNFKLGLASSTFGNLSTILGKESKAGKAMAAAQATIDTYQSAVGAYKSMAGIPIVGPALGAAAAGAAVAAGLANVKKITSTKTPKAEKGALFSIGGQRHSAGGTMFTGEDGTRFEAEKGELIGVMNRNAARHFMAFNNAFPAGGGSTTGNYFESGGIVSRDIAPSQINMQELANLTAEAVKSIPPPVVAVEDIITQGNSYVQVREGANF